MSSREVQGLKWREGHRRKSHRVSALGMCTSQAANCADDPDGILPDITEERNDSQDQEEGPASRTRARNKRKLPIPQDNNAAVRSCRRDDNHEVDRDDQQVVQDWAKSKLGDCDWNRNNGQQSAQCLESSLTPEMPEKCVLELVIDTLQRRDTYEIFGEPVDPTKVEDYYKIIEEPMDFGTMRAKLHEGMYRNLEQFEHDVFLITKNAMCFNPSGTTYFRQARAIHELAKQVFHLLRTNPNDFELQFSEPRRVTRRSQAEVRDQTSSSSRRTRKKVRSSKDITAKASQSPRGPSNLRNVTMNSGSFRTAGHVQASNGPNSGYSRDRAQRSSLPDVHRHSSYRPGTSLLNGSDPICRMTGRVQPLMLVKQQDISYRESLLLFSRGLGLAAQSVVQRKLRALNLALDMFGPDVPESRQENWVSQSSPLPVEKSKSSVRATNASTELSRSHNRRDPPGPLVNKLCDVGASSKTVQPEHAASHFLFDLPYLKARLDQMISSCPERSAQPSLQAEKLSSDENVFRRSLIGEKEPNIHCYSRKRRGS